MISINIGRTFLRTFNEKNNTSYSPKDFFEKIFFELFFNHNKYMVWHTNSPFVQMQGKQKVELLSEKERREKLKKLVLKIKTESPDSCFAIGFPASESKEFATTSGFVSDLKIPSNESDIYYSWIGMGFGIGITQGVCIYFNEPHILWKIFKGWYVYRQFLDDPTINLAPNRINSWNGQWLNYVYSRNYKDDFNFADLNEFSFFKLNNKTGSIVINITTWSKLYFNLARQFPGQTLIGYLYSLGKTNKTYGFIPFYFNQAHNLISFYQRLFGENNALRDSKTYENIFGNATTISKICELGSVGLRALQPKDLKTYFTGNKMPNFKKSKKGGEKTTEKDQLADKEKIILFRTFKTWLVAMITKNNEDMVDYTKNIAKALHAYRSNTKKTVATNLIKKDLFGATTKRQFIEALIKIVENINKEDLEIFKELKNRVHLMTVEDFKYFVVLLKFDYAYEERNACLPDKLEKKDSNDVIAERILNNVLKKTELELDSEGQEKLLNIIMKELIKNT